MSLQRTELRQAIVATLSNMGQAPFPTMAGRHVYDSKGDTVQDNASQEQLPVALVYTDDAAAVFTNMNAWPFSWMQEVSIELGLSGQSTGLETDRELEAMLDRFEYQVLSALFDINQNPLSKNFKRMFNKVIDCKSFRIGHATSNDRLAMRSITFVLEISPECKDLAAAFPPLNTIGLNVANGTEQIDATMNNLQA